MNQRRLHVRFLSAVALVALVALGIPRTRTLNAQDQGLVSSRITPERFQRLVQSVRERRGYVIGELLVKFRDGTDVRTESDVLRLLRLDARAGGQRWVGDVLHLQNAAITDPVGAAELMRRQPEVEFAEPNYITRLRATPNDPDFGRQWNFDAIGVPRAWDINPGGRDDVLVAVIDSGLTTTQQSFVFPVFDGRSFQNVTVPFARTADFDHARVLPGVDFTFWNFMWDTNGHGTHVSGTVAEATNNGLGLAGIAYNTRLLPLKICLGYWDWRLLFGIEGIPQIPSPDDFGGECFTDAGVDAIRFAADAGAKVINLSWGGPDPDPILRSALTYAVQHGAFVAMSAGNSALDGNAPDYPAAYAPDIDGAVSVGATARSGARARYSTFGPFVELAAPGGEGQDLTVSIWQAYPNESDLDPGTLRPRFDRYQEKGIAGTSMASPHVAAVAALLYSQGIRSPQAIEAALKQFARDAGTPGRDNEFGYGVIDVRAALLGLGYAK
jgi:serine protease